MNAIELFHETGQSAEIFYCAECRHVKKTKDDAENCCRCRFCNELVPQNSIGKENFTGYHGECWRADRDKRDAERLAKAEVVTDYDGWVFVEGLGYNDGYFRSMDDLLDYLEDEVEEVRPERAYCCQEQPLQRLNSSDIAERICDDMYEDAYEDLNGLKELDIALEKFFDANAGMKSYYPDYKRCVLVPQKVPQ